MEVRQDKYNADLFVHRTSVDQVRNIAKTPQQTTSFTFTKQIYLYIWVLYTSNNNCHNCIIFQDINSFVFNLQFWKKKRSRPSKHKTL